MRGKKTNFFFFFKLKREIRIVACIEGLQLCILTENVILDSFERSEEARPMNILGKNIPGTGKQMQKLRGGNRCGIPETDEGLIKGEMS